MLYYVPFPGYWLYECSTCHAKVTKGTREEIQRARSEHDQEHACGERHAEVTATDTAWTYDPETSSLQGNMAISAGPLQEAMPF